MGQYLTHLVKNANSTKNITKQISHTLMFLRQLSLLFIFYLCILQSYSNIKIKMKLLPLPLLCVIFFNGLLANKQLSEKEWKRLFTKENIPTHLQDAFFNAQTDTTKIVAIDKIGDYWFMDKSPTEALKYYEQSLALARQKKIKRREGLSLYFIADVYKNLSNIEKSNDYTNQAIAVFKSIDDADGLARVYRHKALLKRDFEENMMWLEKALTEAMKTDNRRMQRLILYKMGLVHYETGDHNTASEYFFKYIASAKADDDKPHLGWGYYWIGDIAQSQADYDKALEYYNKADAMFKKEGNQHDKIIVLKGKGRLYHHQKKYDKALEYYRATLPFYYQYGDRQKVRLTIFEIASVLIEQGNYAEGRDSILKAIAVAKEIGDFYIVPYYEFVLGEAYVGLGNYQKAMTYLDNVNDALIIDTGLADSFTIYAKLAALYEQGKEYKKANSALKKLLALKEEALEKADKERWEELEAKYKTKAQETLLKTQKTQLRQQRLFNGMVGILALFLLAFGGYAYRTAQQRQKTNALLQQQSKELQTLDKAKSRFFANISHELRTPLTLVISPLDSALKRVKNRFVKEDLELAHTNSKKLLSLVNEILDLTKLESGQMKLYPTAIHLEDFMRRVLFSYHSLANLRGLVLNFQYDLDKDLVIETDVPKLEKILNNLLSNAFKYTDAGGAITLRAMGLGGDQMQIEVEDEGRGIAPDEINRIFDRFYQVENQQAPLQGGTGIGLSLAKELAEVLSGTLIVKSERHKGTTFSLRLPLVKSTLPVAKETTLALETKEAKITYAPMSLNNQSAQLLLVEDNPEMAKFLQQILTPYYQCRVTIDGAKALKLTETRSFDLILSDVMMPNMDGFTFLEKMRQQQHTAYTPFILLTARSLEEDKLKGLRLGVDDYITKPFNTNELIARINNLLSNKEKREFWKKNAHQNEQVPADKAIIKKAEQLVMKNLDNSKYRVESLAKDMAYSRRQLVRIIQEGTGLTPVEFIREIRLLKAYEMLEKRQYLTVSEVRFEVGFENASYFTKVFVRRFGVRPSEVLKMKV